MTSSAKYIQAFIEEANIEKALDKINEQAYKNIEKPFFIRKIKKPDDNEDLEISIARNNLNDITDEYTASQILSYLKDNMFISQFNKNFNVFKKILSDKKITSMGQFIEVFTNYRNNIVEDIEKTGLDSTTATVKALTEIKQELNISDTASAKQTLNNLASMTKEELDNRFIDTVLKETGKEDVKPNTIIDLPHSSKYGQSMKAIIHSISPVTLKVNNALQKEPALSKSMIRYILSNQNMFNSSTMRLLQSTDISRGSAVGSGLPITKYSKKKLLANFR